MKQVYAEIVHDALKESGINFVAYLPDDQIHDAQKLLTEDPSFITVGATNEAEAVSACAGAWLGGAPDPILQALQIPYVRASRPEETKEVIMGAKLSTFLWQHPVAVLLSGEVLRD